MTKTYQALLDLTEDLFRHPELGFKEHRTKEKIAAYLSDYDFEAISEFAGTGMKYVLTTGHDKTLALVAEMDAVYAPKHFMADPETGAAHNCGHFSQVGAILGLVDRIMSQPHILATLDYNLQVIFVPAEEYLDLTYRQELKAQGLIEYFGGKQEAIRLGVFDDVDLAVCIHAISESHRQPTIEINCDLAGFMYQYFTFKGQPSHAGFDPFSGVNAYSMGTLFHTALGLGRQQIKDDHYVRINPIVLSADMTTNIIPDQMTIGTDIRTDDISYMQTLADRLSQMAQGCAQALGGNVEIERQMGYLPFVQSRSLNASIKQTFQDFPAIDKLIENRGTVAAAGDIGDLSYLVPTVQIGYSGFEGTIHGNDFKMTDPAFVLSTFPDFLLAVLGDLTGKVETLCDYRRSKEAYLELMDGLG